MGETPHEQTGSSLHSLDAASKRPFNRVTTDAKNDAEHTVATGIDSIQGGKRVPPADGRLSSSGTGEEAQAKNVNSTGQDGEAREAKKNNASQQQHSSLTESTDINSDNNGPVHGGDTAG